MFLRRFDWFQICTYAHTHTHACTHARMHTHTHTHKHTQCVSWLTAASACPDHVYWGGRAWWFHQQVKNKQTVTDLWHHKSHSDQLTPPPPLPPPPPPLPPPPLPPPPPCKLCWESQTSKQSKLQPKETRTLPVSNDHVLMFLSVTPCLDRSLPVSPPPLRPPPSLWVV